jgi:hypothetical protein
MQASGEFSSPLFNKFSRAFAMAAQAMWRTRPAAGFSVLDARDLEQMRIVSFVDESEALPGVLLHVEHERFDFIPAGFHRATRAACTVQFRFDLGEIDHGRLHHVSNFGTLAQFRLFCKCSCNLWKTCDSREASVVNLKLLSFRRESSLGISNSKTALES